MQFNKYNSLENHYQDKFIEALRLHGLTEGQFVCTEKVHGANFSFWCNGAFEDESKLSPYVVRTAKRSGFCDGSFFASHKIDKYKENIQDLYDDMMDKGLILYGDTIVVYGEIFGGSFYGRKEAGAKTVQGGMNYHPDTEFVAFDIGVERIIHDETVKSWISYHDMTELLRGVEIPQAPEIFIGTFEECMAQNNEFATLVPKLFGLTVPEDADKLAAVGEGFVIRPLDGERFLRNGTRVIIKSKNSKFSEKGKGSKVKNSVPLTDNEKALLESFTCYFTENRVNATISKEGEVDSFKQFPKIAGLTFADAINDYEKENFNGMDDDRTLKSVIGDSYSVFTKFAKFESDKVVREVFKRLV
jgi:Rnl2 family RNA ligase